MNRQQEKVELIFKLGLLLSPLQDIADHPGDHDDDSRTRAAAKFSADRSYFSGEAASFARGEPAHSYESQAKTIKGGVLTIQRGLSLGLHDCAALSDLLGQQKDLIISAIMAIPTPAESEVFEAQSPFSTYCAIKDLCHTVTEELLIVDPYLNASVFYRYLRDVPLQVKITLVTSPGKGSRSGEFAAFLDISKVYACERGSDNYSLVVHTDLHDRWVCCDGQVYVLGGSLKDAGRKAEFTLSKLASTEKALAQIRGLLSTDTRLHEPTQPEDS